MVSITLTVEDGKLLEFKESFLREHPIPVDEQGSPTMNLLDWLHEWGRQQFQLAYQRGKTKLAQENIEIDFEIVQVR